MCMLCKKTSERKTRSPSITPPPHSHLKGEEDKQAYEAKYSPQTQAEHIEGSITVEEIRQPIDGL